MARHHGPVLVDTNIITARTVASEILQQAVNALDFYRAFANAVPMDDIDERSGRASSDRVVRTVKLLKQERKERPPVSAADIRKARDEGRA